MNCKSTDEELVVTESSNKIGCKCGLINIYFNILYFYLLESCVHINLVNSVFCMRLIQGMAAFIVLVVEAIHF